MANEKKRENEKAQAQAENGGADSDIGTILPRTVENEMKNSYLDYAMSVIVGRALPDVRDGLKPVHRRVLYAMYELGNTHDKPYKKSARVVGEVLGKYHPHGDVAIYDSIVRMAQDFSLRYPLIDGQGNFGSVDGDNAAAMRYTEVRMKKLAEEMLEDIEKETVAFAPNFDGSLKEPLVLPCKIPNLLINGSSGIAVGMATNIPPHNLGEISDAIIALIGNPSLPLAQLMEIVKGPDFPTGGLILGRRGIADAFSTGRGTIRVRGKAEIVENPKDKARRRIVISEIPYMTNKAQMIEKIADLVKEKRVEGISDITDSSDRDGMHVVIDLKRDANADVTLNQLYAHTQLETTFGVINLALVDNHPRVLSLPETLLEFIKHRKNIITKRSSFDLRQSEDRLHLLDGLKIALEHIDPIVKAIKAAKDVGAARSELMRGYKLSEKQANAILDMKLQRLTALERDKLEKERKELEKRISWLKSLLANEQLILEEIKKEMRDIKEKYAGKRKTEILEQEGDLETEDLIPDEQVAVIITKSDYIKRVPIGEYKIQGRGGKGVIGAETKEEDIIKDLIIASTHDFLLFFTNKGIVHWLKVYQLPSAGRYAMGRALVNLLSLEQDEKIASWIPVKKFSENEFLVMATRGGVVKRSSMMDYSRPRKGGIIAISLKQGDHLMDARLTDGKRDLILGTKAGYAIRFTEEDVREIGRTGQGVRGIKLRKDDEVIGMALNDSDTLLTVSENGYGKRTALDEYRRQGRGGKGVINIQTRGRNGHAVDLRSVSEEDEILLISSKGKMIRMPVSGISVIGRNTQGVRMMKLEEGEKVVAVARVVKETNGNGGEGG